MPATQPSGPTTRPVDIAQWWRQLQDPTLDALIEQAGESNLDLRIATARVRQARAQRGIVSADLWPQVLSSGSYAYRYSSINATERQRSSGGDGPLNQLPSVTIRGGETDPVTGAVGPATITLNPQRAGSSGSGGTAEVDRDSNLFQGGFDADWEIDVFGGLRRAVEAAEAEIEAAEEDRRNVLVTLTSEVALNYIQLRGFQRRLEIAEENIRAQRDTAELTRERHEAGFTSELDVAQAEAQLATTRSQVPLLEAGARQAIHQLGVLLGRPPSALLEELSPPAPLPEVPTEIPVGLPSDLLRRRPDIRAAERRLAAATAQIGVAVSDLYPRFSITGSFGTQTADFKYFLDQNSLFASVGPAIRWPIFEGGRIVSNIELQNAIQEEAFAVYESAILSSLRDVEDALTAYTREVSRYRALSDAVEANTLATQLSNELYSVGRTAFLDVLISQRALYASQDELIQNEVTALADWIALYKALGGGWEAWQENTQAANHTVGKPDD